RPPERYISSGGACSEVGDFEVATGGGIWVAAGAELAKGSSKKRVQLTQNRFLSAKAQLPKYPRSTSDLDGRRLRGDWSSAGE
ncbi:MAG: hypothetical protein L0387_24575, partial [Acidobacteria bacterium]|nr:hypothetical protein [Acidobacteriota bacterium]